MTETEQRIAIAEWCGKKRCPVHLGFECCGQTVPDYLHDLNAMHEVEKGLMGVGPLRRTRCLTYSDLLYQITRRNPRDDEWVFHATAAERAEALLKTIGKWKD